MVKILFSFIGSAIYYTAYVPIWIAWNLAVKYVWRAFLVVFIDADRKDSKERAVKTYLKEIGDPREFIARAYVNELAAGG